MNDFPDPHDMHPICLADGSAHEGTVFLRAALTHPRIEVGAYTYASAHQPPADWAARLAPYLYDFSPERLSIGRFCQIADGVEFITASANHRADGFSSFPFAVFGQGPRERRPSIPEPGADTRVGNDCWLGTGAKLLPGAHLGDGVIVGAGAVVSGTVPDYAVIAGNPARLIRMRFDAPTVAALKEIAWWDWPIEKILRHEAAIVGQDITALRAACTD